MGYKTGVEWTNSTWTPIRARLLSGTRIGWHCEHVNEACKFCYSEGFNMRLGTHLPFKPGHRKDIEIFLDEKMLLAPLRWEQPRMIFVCSMTDLFADFVKDEWIDRMFAVMALCPHLTFQVLTKRPARMREYVNRFYGRRSFFEQAFIKIVDKNHPDPDATHQILDDLQWPLPNVWLGVSVHDQASADDFVPLLLSAPAAVHFVSYEPALGPVDFTEWLHESHCPAGARGEICICEPNPDNSEMKINWIICGGESGPRARPMHPDWARSARDQCAAAGVAFHFKQWGEWAPPDAATHDRKARAAFADQAYRVGKKRAGRLLDGRTHDEFPTPKARST